jgi:hypothetical protein
MLAGDITSNASLMAMRTPPDGLPSDARGCSAESGPPMYAYGWDVGTESLSFYVKRPWFAKSGVQRGANSYVRIYPQDGIAIAIACTAAICAQRLGQQIGSPMLQEIY